MARSNPADVTNGVSYTALQHVVPPPPGYEELQRSTTGNVAIQSETSAPVENGEGS